MGWIRSTRASYKFPHTLGGLWGQGGRRAIENTVKTREHGKELEVASTVGLPLVTEAAE